MGFLREVGKCRSSHAAGFLHLGGRTMLMEESFRKRGELNVLRNVWLVMFEIFLPPPHGLRQNLDQFIIKLDEEHHEVLSRKD